ncbi:MAG TPA: class I SAM-dependent methyltransferase [Bryobacteraceae bacterium]|nr:class I SAM-dependent methyltransferase [Bryobacteraceae bacterium]
MNTDPVRDFYTDHPYPPPVENLDRARDKWRDENRHRSEFHLFWPERPYRADLDILVAGCGTWQAAKYAVCRPQANITGIDVSPTSLDHTEQLKRKYNLTNLEIRSLPIERAGELKRGFDLIVCTGVLHHLQDPDSGLRALRDLLKPEGSMYLMLYAPYGRTGIYLLQDYCRRLGIGTSEREISDLMEVLKALPQHHPLATVLRGSRDAANPGALADALLNPRDRSYSVPQLFDFMERNDLKFGRWYSQAPYLPQCGAIATTPHAERLALLPEYEQYVAMELWRGLIATHSVLVSRGDSSEWRENVRFDDQRWPHYVAIRLPGTVCVQDRLPPGSAGVLLSRYHSFPDLILVIDAHEKKMFDAIDGRRSIGEIAERAGGQDQSSRARYFFEKLFRYDQVVFDTSKATNS